MSEHRNRWAISAAFALALASGLVFETPDSFAQAGSSAPVVLSWTAPGDDGSIGRASMYDIRWRSTDIVGTDTLSWWNGANQVVGEPPPGNAGATDSMSIPNLVVGTTYYFVIRAADEVPNWSGFSNVASVTVQPCDAPTNAPSSLAAAEDTSAVDVVLDWSGTPTPSNPSVSVRIYRATGGGAFALRSTLAGTPTTYRDTSPAAGTTYRYQVAWGVLCGEGPRSSIVSITTAPQVGGPTPSAGAGSGALHIYPNPASGPINLVLTVSGASAARAHIRLFTLSGQWVADLVDDTYDPGQHTLSWSRTGRGGQPVSPGYYEAIGTIGSTRVRERIVLIP